MSATVLPRLYLVSEAAREAHCSEWMIRQEIKAGRLRARRIGRLVRVVDADLARWMAGDEEPSP
jgi:excisionase family DNA binding protein